MKRTSGRLHVHTIHECRGYNDKRHIYNFATVATYANGRCVNKWARKWRVQRRRVTTTFPSLEALQPWSSWFPGPGEWRERTNTNKV